KTVPWGMVEFNPARLVDPDGFTTAPLGTIFDGIQEAIAIAGKLIEIDCEVEEMRVKRVDVARDFASVESVGSLIKGLAGGARTNARKTTLHLTGGGTVEGLSTGSKSGGMARLYDKSLQSH